MNEVLINVTSYVKGVQSGWDRGSCFRK